MRHMQEKQSKVEKKIISLFSKDADIQSRAFKAGGKSIYLFYIDCLVDSNLVANGIFGALNKLNSSDVCKGKNIINCLEKEVIAVASVKKISEDKDVQEEIFNGSVIICEENNIEYLAVNVAGFSKRSITEPPTSSVVRGPREGFIEDINVNLSMVIRRLKTPALAVKTLKVGARTHTKIALVYIDGIVNPKVVKSLEEKLEKIDIDGIIDSYYIEELLSSSTDKFFKRLGNSEKPDVIASRVLEGRIAIMVDGSPIVLTAPFILFEDIQSPGDYYDIPQRSSLVRIVRFVGLLLAILLPGVYVALQSYQYRVLPINFLITLLSSIEGISFPPILEILFVLFLFEILNEASVRMPKQLGMALSIIGALVLGDTAVQAGIITPPSIVVVAISGITLYIIPNQASEASMLRTVFTVIGGFTGIYGIFLGFIILTTYLVTIQSYNVPYMAPFAPSVSTDKKDAFIKKPVSSMIYRPRSFKTKDDVRQVPTNSDNYTINNKKGRRLTRKSTLAKQEGEDGAK